MSIKTPAWVADAIFYQIFPDRFARSEAHNKPGIYEAWEAPPTLYGFKGGDIRGIMERLDYLQELGVTALYFNPIFQSTANHRYHTHDYFKIDPIFGSLDDFREMVDELHRRGMKIVLDAVLNHASRGFYQFNHTLENSFQSPYLEWFHFNKEWMRSGEPIRPYVPQPDPMGEGSFHVHGYQAWWDIAALPKFNTEHPEVREFLMQVATFWMEFGIDGWRLDVPDEIDDDEFWREFRRRIKAINPEAYICGEIWHGAERWLQGDQFDGVMNYLFTRPTLSFFLGDSLNYAEVSKCGYGQMNPICAPEFASALQHAFTAYPPEVLRTQLNLLGSHDTPRILNVGTGDAIGVRLAFMCMFTVPGAPCIYYGDEVGLAGDHDPDNRRGFDWDPLAWDQELQGLIKQFIAMRKDWDVLRSHHFEILHAEDGQIVYQRLSSTEQVIVAFNNATSAALIQLDMSSQKSHFPAKFNSLYVESGHHRELEGGSLEIQIPGREGLVLGRKRS